MQIQYSLNGHHEIVQPGRVSAPWHSADCRESEDDIQAKTDAGINKEENWSLASLLGSSSQMNSGAPYVWGVF